MKARDLELEQAVMRERARCLWCLDQILVELRAELQKKLLIESERHVIQVKVRLADAIVKKARRGIVSGAKPKGAEKSDDLHDHSGPDGVPV